MDDDREIRDLLAELLAALGFEVRALATVTDPEAIAVLRPAAVITDLRVAGHEPHIAHLERMRAHADLAATPILACSGDVFALRRHRRRLKELKVATLSRPFAVGDLERRIRQLLAGSSSSP